MQEGQGSQGESQGAGGTGLASGQDKKSGSVSGGPEQKTQKNKDG